MEIHERNKKADNIFVADVVVVVVAAGIAASDHAAVVCFLSSLRDVSWCVVVGRAAAIIPHD